jgi:AcrR family transcriptional regulator
MAKKAPSLNFQLAFEALNRAPSSSDLKRASILSAVVKILAQEGLDELTFEKIGKRVKMARSHVVYYFPHRDELVMAAIRFAAMSASETILRHLEAADGWKKKLHRYIEGNFAWIEENPEHATVYTLLYYLSTFKPEYRKLHSEIRRAGSDRIAGILEEGPAKGRKRLVQAYAKSIQGVITGNLIDVMTTDQAAHLKERCQETLDSVDELIDGI